jgi:hypothetical protein
MARRPKKVSDGGIGERVVWGGQVSNLSLPGAMGVEMVTSGWKMGDRRVAPTGGGIFIGGEVGKFGRGKIGFNKIHRPQKSSEHNTSGRQICSLKTDQHFWLNNTRADNSAFFQSSEHKRGYVSKL